MLTIFGEWAFPRLDVEGLIGSDKMRESRMLNRVREKANWSPRGQPSSACCASASAWPPADIPSTLDAVDQVEQLDSLLDLAATCASLDAFQQVLRTQGTTR